jgi:hypothetical protein
MPRNDEAKQTGQMGRLEEKNRSNTSVLTAFISLGRFNMFPLGALSGTYFASSLAEQQALRSVHFY